MKGIRQFLLFALLFSGRAECQTGSPPKTARPVQNIRYTIGFQVPSPDQQWTAFRKIYDAQQDTLVVVNHRNPKLTRQYAGVQQYYFTPRSNLLLVRAGSAELITSGSGTLKKWEDLTQTAYQKSGNRLITISKREGSEPALDIWSGDTLVRHYGGVDRFYTDKEQLYFTRQEGQKTFLYAGDQAEKPMYSTDRKIADLSWAGEGDTVWTEEKEDGSMDLVYLSRDHTAFRIREDTDMDFKTATVSPVRGTSCFFVCLTLAKPPDPKSLRPDIWHTEDRHLETKFYEGAEDLYMIWDPARHNLSTITDGSRTEAVNIGNKNYLITFDPYLKQDYVHYDPDVDFYRYDIGSHSSQFLGTGKSTVVYGATGNYFLSNPDHEWSLFDLQSLKVKKLKISDRHAAYFSERDNWIIFEGDSGLIRYHTADNRVEQIPFPEGPTVLNGSTEPQRSRYSVSKNTYKSGQPLLLKLDDPLTDETSVWSYESKKNTVLVSTTRQRLESFVHDAGRLQSYVAEDYHVPPYLVVNTAGSLKTVYRSNITDHAVHLLHSERIRYTNSEGVPLTGILYFPAGYDEKAVYPMIVSIYQRQSRYGNQYLRDGFFQRTEGLNIRSYVEKSYFVFLPDIVFGKSGTGFSALDCVHRALDALTGYKAIDRSKIGLIGHSHGGYEVNFIATHSDRFAAYASGAGNSDLVRSYFSFNYNFLKPFYWQFENEQYEMPGSFEAYKDLYVRNSPIYSVSAVTAPILLWAGEQDRNIDWNQVMEFYTGLKRNHKYGIALFYPDEGHGFLKNENRMDITGKIEEWFACFLKSGKQADWMMLH